MIKLYCNRCGKEIKDKYYTMSFTEHYTNSVNKLSNITISGTLTTATVDTYITYIEPTELEKLNSKKVYCDKCKKEIEEMDLGCDTNVKDLIEALKNDDKFEKLVKDTMKRL